MFSQMMKDVIFVPYDHMVNAIWLVATQIFFIFTPMGKIPNLTNIFQMS